MSISELMGQIIERLTLMLKSGYIDDPSKYLSTEMSSAKG